MSLNDKTPVKTEKTSQNANFVAQNARKFPGLLKMRSPDAILEIAKHLKTSDAVIEAFDAYAEVVLKSEYELSFKEANRTYVRGRSMLHNYRRIVLALCEIDDDTIFLTTYPAVISKHFFNAENLFSKDDNYGYVTKPGSSVRKAPAGIPIPEISELLSRTRRIVVKRFADWDGVYSVDATSTREFFRRCLELADEHNDTINTIKSILEDLDSVLIAWPKKKSSESSVEEGKEVVPVKSAELASVPEFLKWDENFKGNSENLILKKLSNIASGKRCIEKRHVDDILDVFKTMYLDTGKFEVAIEQQKQYAIRRVAGKYKTDVEIYPLSACGFYNSKAPSGFNKGELPSGVLFGVIGTIAGRIKNHAVDEVFLHFHKRLVDEFKVYLVGDLMHRAFVNDEWSKNTFKKTGYDFDSIGSVRLARFFLMGQDERQKLVNEKSRGVSAAKTASEFFDSIYHLAEMELRSIEENNRSYSAYSWLDEILKPRELVLLKEPNTGSGVYRVYSEYLEAFLSTDAVLSMFQKVLSSVKSIDELLAWHIEKSELPGWAYGRFSEKNEIAAIDIFRSLMRANYDDGYAEKEYTNPLYSVLLNAESIDIVSRVLLLSVASYPNAGFFRNEVVPYIRKMPKTPDTQKAFLWAVAEALGGCQTVDDVMKRILDSYQKREKESSWQYVDRSSKERIQNEEAYPIALEAFMDTDDGKCAKELLDADAFDITDFDYAMASFFLDAISDFQAEQKRYNNR